MAAIKLPAIIGDNMVLQRDRPVPIWGWADKGEEVTVTVALPDWTEVAGASASSGEVHPLQPERHDPCPWVLGRIEAHSKEKLALKIIPRQSKPFELGSRRHNKPMQPTPR